MSLFQYPKTRHLRTLSPRQFRRYGTYKKYLQYEFTRTCVYCREPDTATRNIVFQVDHYRPKSVSAFAKLVCDYQNLFYCCGACNSRKNDYWPVDEVVGPHIINPCDYSMAAHLRYDAKSFEIEAKSPHSKWMIELLDLNEDVAVASRRNAQTLVGACLKGIAASEAEMQKIMRAFNAGHISAPDRDKFIAEISEEISNLKLAVESVNGTTPLPPLPLQRNGLKLI